MSDSMILSMNAESNTQGLGSHATGSRGKELLRAARILPLAMVAAGVVTIFVPVLDSGNADGPSIRITSLGYSPLNPTNLDPGMSSVLVLFLTLAVLPWLFRASQWWSVAAILVGVLNLVSFAVFAIGSLALVAAGVCGWVGGRRLKRGAQA